MGEPFQLFVLQFGEPMELSRLDIPGDASALSVLFVTSTPEEARQVGGLLQGTIPNRQLVKCVTRDTVVAAGFLNMALSELRQLPQTLSPLFAKVKVLVCAAAVGNASTSLAMMYNCNIANHFITKELVDSLVTKSVGSFLDIPKPEEAHIQTAMPLAPKSNDTSHSSPQAQTTNRLKSPFPTAAQNSPKEELKAMTVPQLITPEMLIAMQNKQIQQLQAGAGIFPFQTGIIGMPPYAAMQMAGIPFGGLQMPTFAMPSVIPFPIAQAQPQWTTLQATNLNPYAAPFQAVAQAKSAQKKTKKYETSPTSMSPSMQLSPQRQHAPWRVSVRFKRGGSEYSSISQIQPDTFVIVEGDRGLDLGVAVECRLDVENSKASGVVLRLASESEVEQHRVLLAEEEQCLAVVCEKVKAHSLTMRVWDVAFQFDKAKLTVFYTAPDRQDFRNLCRELYKLYHARIWFELLKEEQQAQGHPYFVKGGNKRSKEKSVKSPPSGSQSPGFSMPLLTPNYGNDSPGSQIEDSPDVQSADTTPIALISRANLLRAVGEEAELFSPVAGMPSE